FYIPVVPFESGDCMSYFSSAKLCRNANRAQKKLSRSSTRRSLRAQVEPLEDRVLPSTIEFIQTIGTAANFSNTTANFTSMPIPITTGHDVSAGHGIFVELALDPKNLPTTNPSSVVTVTDTQGNSYHLDAFRQNSKTTVETVLFSSLGVKPLSAANS